MGAFFTPSEEPGVKRAKRSGATLIPGSSDGTLCAAIAEQMSGVARSLRRKTLSLSPPCGWVHFKLPKWVKSKLALTYDSTWRRAPFQRVYRHFSDFLALEHLCQALVAVGEVMAPAVEVVIENHIATQLPLIIEGDGILPSLFGRRALQEHISVGRVRGAFLIESDEKKLFDALLKRGRGINEMSDTELHTHAHAKWLSVRCLIHEAQHYDPPLLHSLPSQHL